MKKIPLHSMVILVGPTSGGKTTLANQYFEPYEIIGVDQVRSQLLGDPSRRDLNNETWDMVYAQAKFKLKHGERVVIDGTHLKRYDRMKTVKVAQLYGVPIFYIVVNRDHQSKFANLGWREKVPYLVDQHEEIFNYNLRDILRGDGVAEVVDARNEPFEVIKKLPRENLLDYLKQRSFNGITAIGDVHGVLESMKSSIDWARSRNNFIIFLGDVIDYGPKSLQTMELAYDYVTRGLAAFTIGNHELKIYKWLRSRDNKNYKLRLSAGNKITVDAFTNLTFKEQLIWNSKFNALMTLGANHWQVDNVLFTHAAATPDMFDMSDRILSGPLGNLATYGQMELSSSSEEKPTRRYDWIDEIPENKKVIVGHSIRSRGKPLVEVNVNNSEIVFLDTGSGKGGALTSLDIPFNGSELKITNFNRY